MENRTHTYFCVELTALFSKLEDYQPPTTDLEILRQRQEDEKVFVYLAALDQTYEQIRSQILLGAKLPDLETTIATV